MKAVIQAQSPTNLKDMPVEIIDLIAEHLRAASVEKPKVSRKWEPCPCVVPKELRSSKRKDPSAFASDDPCLALSCVSKRMRNVVFDNRIHRTISTSYCDWGMKQAQAASEVMRSNVR